MTHKWEADYSWVIVYGDLGEGLQGVVGNFSSEESAEDYADTHNLGHFQKYIFQIERPGCSFEVPEDIKGKVPSGVFRD